MQPSPKKDDFLLTPPTKSGNRNSSMSKAGTWFSYKVSVHKEKIIRIVSFLAIIAVLWGTVSFGMDYYKDMSAKRAEVQRVEAIKQKSERLESLRNEFNTQALLTPMDDASIDKVIDYARASYLDSIKDLSRAFYSMEYIAKEDKFEVVFESTQNEMTEMVNYMNSEYVEVLKFMNTHKELVRTYKAALDSGNMDVINLTKDKIDKNKSMKNYSDWYGWMVSGQYRKIDSLKERANRHINNVVSLDGLNKYLQSKKTQIDNLEPFTQMVVRR